MGGEPPRGTAPAHGPTTGPCAGLVSLPACRGLTPEQQEGHQGQEHRAADQRGQLSRAQAPQDKHGLQD
jgi:hypothetical protein